MVVYCREFWNFNCIKIRIYSIFNQTKYLVISYAREYILEVVSSPIYASIIEQSFELNDFNQVFN